MLYFAPCRTCFYVLLILGAWRLFVSLSLCPSVTLVDCGHIVQLWKWANVEMGTRQEEPNIAFGTRQIQQITDVDKYGDRFVE